MRLLTITIVALLIFAAAGFAQDKVTPPTTRMEAPDDSVAGDTTMQKPSPNEPELELPEVLILGKNRTVRTSENKASLAPDSPSLVKPDAPSDAISTWFREQTLKPSFNRQLSITDERFRTRLDVGNYLSMAGTAEYWRQLETGDVRGTGWFDHTGGEFRNSHQTQGGGNVNLNFGLAEDLRTRLSGGYAGESAGLYTVLDTNAIRSVSSGNLETRLSYDITRSSNAEFDFRLHSMSARTDTGNTRIAGASDLWYSVTGKYSDNYAGFPVLIMGEMLREQYSRENIPGEMTAISNNVGLEVQIPFSGQWTSTFGIMYQTFGSDSVNTGNRFSPWGRLNFVPNNHLGFSLRAYTGYQYEPFSRRYGENRFTSYAYPLRADEVRFGAQFSVALQLSEQFALNGRLDYTNMKVLQYWELSQSGMFRLREINGVEIVAFGFDAETTPADWVQLIASLEIYTTFYDDAGIAIDDAIPYRPRLEVPIRADFQLPKELTLQVESTYSGERYVDLTGSTTLEPYWQLNSTLSRDFGKHYTAFFQVNNLLNQKYNSWENYPARRFRILLGVQATF
ncbi:MAG: TonB-dependent receptor [Candidatus Marinimicrobia bacterium]|nr:TonB-dependent receptor [Candidatus Neomarinimicrobiota bacterium]MCF7828618.1 TonB-dependent receptor [Candidatus Neomarinimicrobiota bacterium]MCF7880359.1 TonB-dependent receptor [Candidatus Neomarinimicrobiota bacterium]